jgi:hypothetical protein
VLVSFRSTETSLPSTDVALTIRPGSDRTDAVGQVTTTTSLAADCPDKCPGQDCNTSGQEIEATAGSVVSTPVTINISVP